MDTKFGKDVSNEMLLNTAKFQGYSFYRSWVFKGKSTGSKIPPSHLPDWGYKNIYNYYSHHSKNTIFCTQGFQSLYELFISGFQELIQLESTFEYAYRIGLFDKG